MTTRGAESSPEGTPVAGSWTGQGLDAGAALRQGTEVRPSPTLAAITRITPHVGGGTSGTASSTPETASSTSEPASSTPETASSTRGTASSTPGTSETASSTPGTSETASSTRGTASSTPGTSETASSTPGTSETASSTRGTASSTPGTSETASSTRGTASSRPGTASSTPGTSETASSTRGTPETASSMPGTASSTRGTSETASSTSETAGAAADRRRWLALAFIAAAQLMVALDATIVNIALPTVQASLQFSDAQRQWVITAYTLAFGGLLLLGGRVADAAGRKRALLIALAGFATASAVSGAAVNLPMLLVARAMQGAFAALLAPSALALLAVTFTEPRDRARAFAVYGGIAGSGGAAGLVLGGALTQYLDWRWCLYVNVPIAAIAAVGIWRLVIDVHPRSRQRFDVLGVLLGGGGLVALVDASTEVVTRGWQAPQSLVPLLAGPVALAGFAAHQARNSAPLLPPRIVLNRTRGGAYLSAALAVAGMFGAFLFLTYELQAVFGYPPLQAALGFLPLSAAAMLGSGLIASQLLPRVPPRALIVPGFLVAASGMALLTQLQASSGYINSILPAELLLGLGIGLVMVPASSLAAGAVEPREAGIASATLNVSQQVGASLGVAVLNTLAASTTNAYLAAAPGASRADALVHGYATAATFGAAILIAASVLAAWLIRGYRRA